MIASMRVLTPFRSFRQAACAARLLLAASLTAFAVAWGPAAQAQTATIGATLDWWKLDEDMLTFLCLPEEQPAWCADARAGIRPPAPPPPEAAPGERRRGRGGPPPPPPPPPKSVDDETWQGLVEELTRRRPRPADIATLERRGFEDGDPVAFEMLGYAYAAGWGRPKNLALGYQYYGLALVRGRTEVQPNLDELWRFLSADEQRFIQFRFQRAFPSP